MTNAIDLTTLSAVRNRIPLEATSTSDDAEIQGAITAFSQWLLSFTGRTSLNSIETLDEIYDGKGNPVLFLRSFPIVTLIFVNMNGISLPFSSGFGSWGVYIEQGKRSIALRGGVGNFSTFPYPQSQAMYRKGPAFLPGLGNIEVAYTAGYPPVAVVNEIATIAAQTITLQRASWVADAGVLYYPSLVPMANVLSSPAVGEYAVSAGLYVFNVTDNTRQVAVSYDVNQAPYDLEYAVRCVVALNYKRKAWQDQASRGTTTQGASSTTRYRDWAWPPEMDKVFESYQRKAIL